MQTRSGVTWQGTAWRKSLLRSASVMLLHMLLTTTQVQTCVRLVDCWEPAHERGHTAVQAQL